MIKCSFLQKKIVEFKTIANKWNSNQYQQKISIKKENKRKWIV